MVEDEFIILMELESILIEAGAQAVLSCRTLEAALALAKDREINVALLDVRIGRETIAPVARCLASRGVPFAFYTGQSETDPIRSEWPDCRIMPKPSSAKTIVGVIAGLLRRRVG